MKKLFYTLLYLMIVFFFVDMGTLNAQSSVLSWDFESDTIGQSFTGIGWNPTDCQAVVADDPVATGNNVLQNTIGNYNAAPVLQFILPAGKTLADYDSFVFSGYFAQGDVGYKDIMVEAYQTLPTGAFNNNADAKIGTWNRAQMGSSAWENITIDIANTTSLTDTIYIAFGIHCAGTGDVGGTGVATIWYADSVTLVAKPAANPSAVFESSKNTIDFGSDTVGIAKQDSVEIYNRGTDTLKVTPVSSTNALFTFSPSAFSIAPSDSSKLTITFTPVDTSSQSGFIILAHNALGSPDSVSVRGKGIGQSLPIVTNGGFESSETGVVDTTDVKGWLISVGSGVTPPPIIEIVSDTVKEGNRALKVTVNAATSTQWDIQAVADSLRVKPNGRYDYSIWAKAATAGAQVNFTMGYYSTGEISAIRPATLSTQWQKFTMQFTVTNNEAYIRGPVHFSYTANVGNTIYIDDLQITEVIPDPVDSSKIWKGPALAAGQYKFLGNVPSEPPENTFTNYWTQLTPENAGKWGSVGTSTDTTQWNWTGLDAQYNYAMNNNLVYKHHTLIWGAQQPSWISSLDSATQYFYIDAWIKKVGQRYPNMDMVDVVNEPLYGHQPPDGDNGRANYKNALGGNGTTGWDWLIKSFELARQYIPNAKLLINDYGIINSDANTTSYIQIIGLLTDRGLIDGIGCQAHGLESTSAATIQSNLDRLAATGLPIYISEFDLNIQDDNQQKTKYQELFPVMWQHPSVKGVTLWGYIQDKTWLTYSYLVNNDGTARPALWWLAQYIEDNPTGVKTSTAELPTHYQLAQNFPNPFNPTTNIRYDISKISQVTLKVFDILGRQVQTLVNTLQVPGQYTVTFNAQNLSSGIYFYQLQAGTFTETKKLMLLK